MTYQNKQYFVKLSIPLCNTMFITTSNVQTVCEKSIFGLNFFKKEGLLDEKKGKAML